MSTKLNSNNAAGSRGRFFYGWVIVAACCALLVMNSGINFSFGVFFKPLAAYFGSSREAISGVFSIRQVSQGTFAIPMGWLADRFGPARVVAFCGLMAGLGLMLAGRANSLWQLYLIYGVIVGIGLSGGFAAGAATTARWFLKKHRGLALGIVSAGMGLGTLIMVPIAERLVATSGWEKANEVFAIIAWVAMIGSAIVLRRSPPGARLPPGGAQDKNPAQLVSRTGVSLREAVRSKPMWMLVFAYFLLAFCVQLVMIHLVNYTTDIGISPLAAVSAVSVIGMSSVAGRITMGTASDRIGAGKALFLCFAVVMVALVWLIFARGLWAFYLFAIVFGFAWGGEVPQMPILIGQFYGLRAVAALVGVGMVGINAGGAIGSWVAGKIFDVTSSYQTAFIIAAVAGLLGTILTLMLNRQRRMVVQAE